jgi:hypothetical protein
VTLISREFGVHQRQAGKIGGTKGCVTPVLPSAREPEGQKAYSGSDLAERERRRISYI